MQKLRTVYLSQISSFIISIGVLLLTWNSIGFFGKMAKVFAVVGIIAALLSIILLLRKENQKK